MQPRTPCHPSLDALALEEVVVVVFVVVVDGDEVNAALVVVVVVVGAARGDGHQPDVVTAWEVQGYRALRWVAARARAAGATWRRSRWMEKSIRFNARCRSTKGPKTEKRDATYLRHELQDAGDSVLVAAAREVGEMQPIKYTKYTETVTFLAWALDVVAFVPM
jgi:hypothetical protein